MDSSWRDMASATNILHTSMGAQRPDTIAWRDAAILALVAGALRAIAFGRLGVDHFDEGGYAMTAAALASGAGHPAIYPLQHFLSPPLFFGLGAAGMRLAGTLSAGVLIAISAAAGAATAAALYLAGRRWFGPAAAGAAALAIALSDYHILYSRAGLTDVLFTLLLVLAVAAFAAAEERENWTLAMLAGLLTGLAWNTKYHGWLAGVIAAGAVLPGLLAPARRPWRPTLLRLALAALVAAAAYAPWALYVESREGGYTGLAAEHARFLKPAAAVRNTLAQWRAQQYLEGWTARLAPLAMVAWVLLHRPQARRFRAGAWAVVLVLGSLALGASTVIGLLGFAGAAVLLVRHGRSWTPHWVPLAFLGAFTVLTPLYQPYPRLLMPWLAAAALLAGVALEALLAWSPSALVIRATPAAAAAAMGAVIAVRGVPDAANPWRPRDGLRVAAREADRMTAGPAPVVVIGEPAVVFYLRRTGREAWHVDRPADIPRYVPAGRSYYLVGGIYSRRVRGPRSLAAWLEGHPEAVAIGRAHVPWMSDVRLLDDFGPDAARRYRQAPRDDYDLTIYRVDAAP
jgi:hypothetical protein